MTDDSHAIDRHPSDRHPVDRHPIDRIVGERIRARRRDLGLSQARLAERLGVTYQQLQKYETGANKVSVSRLHALCQALGVEPVFFFDLASPAGGPRAAEPSPTSPSEDECRRVIAAFRRIRTAPLRRSIIAMIEAACRHEDGPAPTERPRKVAAKV